MGSTFYFLNTSVEWEKYPLLIRRHKSGKVKVSRLVESNCRTLIFGNAIWILSPFSQMNSNYIISRKNKQIKLFLFINESMRITIKNYNFFDFNHPIIISRIVTSINKTVSFTPISLNCFTHETRLSQYISSLSFMKLKFKMFSVI